MSLRLPLLYGRVSYICGSGLRVVDAFGLGSIGSLIIETPQRGHSQTYSIQYGRAGSIRSCGAATSSESGEIAIYDRVVDLPRKVQVSSDPMLIEFIRGLVDYPRSSEFYSLRSLITAQRSYYQDVTVPVDIMYAEIYPDASSPPDTLFDGTRLSRGIILFKIGSTLPYHNITFCRLGDPRAPLDLTGATVRIIATDHLTGEIRIDKPLEIVDAERGACRLMREEDEYKTPASCRAEFFITFDDGEVLILPESRYYRLSIEDSL